MNNPKNKIMKSIALFAILLVVFSLSAIASFAHEDEDELALGKQLVESKVSCDQLDDEKLEAIGEYLMEQVHPGESHDAMHKMMGIDEDTEEHKQFHVQIAKYHYCNDFSDGMMNNFGMMGNNNMMSGRGMIGGMMSSNMMPMMMNMMSGGMMGNNYQNYGGNKMAYGMMNGYGMMGGYGTAGYGSGMMSSGMFWLNGFLAFLLLIGLVVLVWLWVFKSWNDLTKKNKK